MVENPDLELHQVGWMLNREQLLQHEHRRRHRHRIRWKTGMVFFQTVLVAGNVCHQDRHLQISEVEGANQFYSRNKFHVHTLASTKYLPRWEINQWAPLNDCRFYFLFFYVYLSSLAYYLLVSHLFFSITLSSSTIINGISYYGCEFKIRALILQ